MSSYIEFCEAGTLQLLKAPSSGSRIGRDHQLVAVVHEHVGTHGLVPGTRVGQVVLVAALDIGQH